MTVDQMLTRVSSYELTQWMAFEKVNGPLGQQYTQDMLANIHEQLQQVSFILGRMSAGDESPVPLPARMRRPHEVLFPSPDQDEVDSVGNLAAAESLRAQLAFDQRIQAEEAAKAAKAAEIAENLAVAQELKKHLPGT